MYDYVVKRNSFLPREEYVVNSTGEHEGSFSVPPLPPRTPAPLLPPPPTTSRHSEALLPFPSTPSTISLLSPVSQAGLAIKNPPKKPTQKNLPKKPTKNVFFSFLIFYENDTNFSL
jgi:hypothetical protein